MFDITLQNCLGDHSVPGLNLIHCHTHGTTQYTFTPSPLVCTQIVIVNYERIDISEKGASQFI